jgi:uncharacterized protein YjbI with pentapeptide repeats
MILPWRARVRPRVISTVTGDCLLLQDEVAELMARRPRGSIRLVGAAGAGKTTALRHLADFLLGSDTTFLDCPDANTLFSAAFSGWVVFTTARSDADLPFTDSYDLAPWRDDEWIEYLLEAHKERCRSVLTRVWSDEGRDLLEGNPLLCRIVLDQLAARDVIPSVRAALLHYVEEHFPDPVNRSTVQEAALEYLLGSQPEPAGLFRVQESGAEELVALLRFRALQLVLAADRIAADIRGNKPCDYLRRQLPRDLVRQVADEIAGQSELREVLLGRLAKQPHGQAMVASILHATGWQWIPQAGAALRLAGAYLDGVAWPEVVLPGIDLQHADLSQADFRKADLTGALLAEANLQRADLREATLAKVDGRRANLTGADMHQCNLWRAMLNEANLERSLLRGADLQTASLQGAALTGASLDGADLRRAILVGANLEEADFSGVNLECAQLQGLKLRGARFAGARFAAANLSSCDMEEMELPGADFQKANLKQALLTGSMMRGACFDNARLTGAGLADIDWEQASLRGADLRCASFHAGSSRSGRVGSPIACEGSRTGFYTDDYTEQDFKSPEEIRKANLCYADLRGANLDGVDFYLVDLRHALFDRKYEKHLRRCGAILEDRGPPPA